MFIHSKKKSEVWPKTGKWGGLDSRDFITDWPSSDTGSARKMSKHSHTAQTAGRLIMSSGKCEVVSIVFEQEEDKREREKNILTAESDTCNRL
jgi:hypothetical protein